MKNMFVLCLAASFLFFTACESTELSSVKAPDVDLASYGIAPNRILVFADSEDIGFRKTIETDLVEEFTEGGRSALPCIEVISPLKKYESDELSTIYEEYNVDSILTITLTGADTQSFYIPPSSYTTYTNQWVNGSMISVPETHITGGYSGIYLVTKIQVELSDIKTGELVFLATADTEGGDMNSISASLAERVVKEFMEE